MVLNQLWNKYSYVILLFTVIFLCGLFFINALIQSGHNQTNSETNSTVVTYINKNYNN